MAETSPLDFFKPGTQFAPREVALERLRTCGGCERLLFKVCQECGCFMPMKTKLAAAECPIGKWGPHDA